MAIAMYNYNAAPTVLRAATHQQYREQEHTLIAHSFKGCHMNTVASSTYACGRKH